MGFGNYEISAEVRLFDPELLGAQVPKGKNELAEGNEER